MAVNIPGLPDCAWTSNFPAMEAQPWTAAHSYQLLLLYLPHTFFAYRVRFA